MIFYLCSSGAIRLDTVISKVTAERYKGSSPLKSTFFIEKFYMSENKIEELANKLKQGIKAYFPPNFERLSMIERDELYSKIIEERLNDYNEYYNKRIEEVFKKITDKVIFTSYNSLIFHELLSIECRYFEMSETIINQFRWKLITESDNEFTLYFYDCPRNNVDIRCKVFNIFVDNGYEINIQLIDDKFIPISNYKF